MAVRVTFDPNLRASRDRTFVLFDDVEGGDLVAPGEEVEVWEPESGLHGPAIVESVDSGRGVVYLDVEWEKLRIATVYTPGSQQMFPLLPANHATDRMVFFGADGAYDERPAFVPRQGSSAAAQEVGSATISRENTVGASR